MMKWKNDNCSLGYSEFLSVSLSGKPALTKTKRYGLNMVLFQKAPCYGQCGRASKASGGFKYLFLEGVIIYAQELC